MRTTLTLDPDVAALAKQIQRRRGRRFKTIVNEALRRGLHTMAAPPTRPVAYQTPAADLGRGLAGSLDDIAEVLAVAEGEASGAPRRCRPAGLTR